MIKGLKVVFIGFVLSEKLTDPFTLIVSVVSQKNNYSINYLNQFFIKGSKFKEEIQEYVAHIACTFSIYLKE